MTSTLTRKFGAALIALGLLAGCANSSSDADGPSESDAAVVTDGTQDNGSADSTDGDSTDVASGDDDGAVTEILPDSEGLSYPEETADTFCGLLRQSNDIVAASVNYSDSNQYYSEQEKVFKAMIDLAPEEFTVEVSESAELFTVEVSESAELYTEAVDFLAGSLDVDLETFDDQAFFQNVHETTAEHMFVLNDYMLTEC